MSLRAETIQKVGNDMRYQAVLFDFDYTLGDATDAIVAGFTAGFTGMGLPAPQREAVRKTVGMVLEDAYTSLSGDGTAEGRSRFRDLFSAVARPMQAQNTPLCAGAEALLLALRDAGVTTAVVSSKHAGTLETIFAQHCLDRVVSFIIGGDQVSRNKPDPESLNMALTRLGLAPHQVLYCGDTLIDARAAQAAGVDFCAVLNGTTPGADFQAVPHVHIAPDLPDLRRWLAV